MPSDPPRLAGPEMLRAYWDSELERAANFSRAVRFGNLIFVSGTTARGENGAVVGEGDVYQQGRFIFEQINRALKELGSCLEHVVRTRMFLVDSNQISGIVQAHSEAFVNTRPAAACYGISSLFNDKLLVEVEVDAIAR